MVSRLPDSYESRELDSVRWLPGNNDYADALTKRNVEFSKHFNEMLSSGTLSVDTTKPCTLDANT